jgi:hypothetical protein
MQTFDSWDQDDVMRTFDVHRTKNFLPLQRWLGAVYEHSEAERSFIANLQEDLFVKIDGWNEDELKFKFIAPFVSLVRFESENISVFTQRQLSATVDGIELQGRVDFVVATGQSKPIAPFFFIHEYKRTFAPDSDPLAQLLVEMLTAQELNHHRHPIYGCYVIGRNWHFVVLEGHEFDASDAYTATKSDIFTILSILKEAKTIINHLAKVAS